LSGPVSSVPAVADELSSDIPAAAPALAHHSSYATTAPVRELRWIQGVSTKKEEAALARPPFCPVVCLRYKVLQRSAAFSFFRRSIKQLPEPLVLLFFSYLTRYPNLSVSVCTTINNAIGHWALGLYLKFSSLRMNKICSSYAWRCQAAL